MIALLCTELRRSYQVEVTMSVVPTIWSHGKKMTALIAFGIEHQGEILAALFAVSEVLGANPKVKANGFLSLAIMGVRKLNGK